MRARHPLPHQSEQGSAAVEFALVGPLFIFLIIAAVVYGSWLWMAQGVQSLAAEGARAAIAGINAEERADLARTAVTGSVDGSTILEPESLHVSVSDDGSAIRVIVTYDATHHPLLALAGLVPPPPQTIRREAVVRTGGY